MILRMNLAHQLSSELTLIDFVCTAETLVYRRVCVYLFTRHHARDGSAHVCSIIPELFHKNAGT